MSLKTLSMRRVVELGLTQEWLPRTVKEELRTGPRPRKLEIREHKMINILNKVARNLEEESYDQTNMSQIPTQAQNCEDTHWILDLQ